MVVVVQFLAEDPDPPGIEIVAVVARPEGSVAERVSETVDDVPHERHPEHHARPDDESGDEPEQEQVEDEHEPDSQTAALRVDVALDPVVRGPFPVLLEQRVVFRSFPVEEEAAEGDVRETLERGRVRIALAVGVGVVLPMDRNPLLRHDPGREPAPETHRVLDHRVEDHSAVRGRAVQVERVDHVREVTGDEDPHEGDPPRFSQDPVTWHAFFSSSLCVSLRTHQPNSGARRAPIGRVRGRAGTGPSRGAAGRGARRIRPRCRGRPPDS